MDKKPVSLCYEENINNDLYTYFIIKILEIQVINTNQLRKHIVIFNITMFYG